MTIDIDGVKKQYFCEAYGELAYVEQLLLGVNIENPSESALSEILRAIRKIKVGSVVCHFKDITDIAFLAEYILDKVIEKKLMLTSEYVEMFLKFHGMLNSQLDSYRLGTPVDQSQVVEVRGLLNEALNQGVR